MTLEQISDAITNKGVNNISSVELPPSLVEGLAVGLKCALPPPSLQRKETYLAEADDFMSSLAMKAYFCQKNNGTIASWTPPPFYFKKSGTRFAFNVNGYYDPHLEKDLRHLHTRLKDTLSDFVDNVRAPGRPALSRLQLQLVRDFAQRPDITIQNADKGLGLSVMDTDWYLSKGEALLSTGYEPLTFAEAQTLIKQTWSTQHKALVTEKVVLQTRNFIESKPPLTHSIPVLYLMPKLHKTPVGVRPIVAGHSFCFTPAAIVLDKLLSFAFSDSTVILSDSATLIRKLESTEITDASCFLASADISNLYGEIPLDELHTVALSAIAKTSDPWLKHLLTGVLHCNVIEFNTKLYRQTTGVAMGSPFGPTAANLFLHAKIDHLLTSTALFPEIMYVFRYLDDVFFILKGTTDIADFKTRLNGLHPAMKFTLETSDTSCDFLDITVYKGNRFAQSSLLDTRVFQKPMNKFLYIPYTSFHRKVTLTGFIGTEVRRFIRISSDELAFLDTLVFFVRNLRARGYPSTFIIDALEGIEYARRAEYLTPRDKTANATDLSSLLIYKSHLDTHSKHRLFSLAIRHFLRTATTELKAPYHSPYLLTVLENCTKMIVALRRSPSLYQTVINNKPTVNVRFST